MRRWTVRLALPPSWRSPASLLREPLARAMGIDAYGAAAATVPTVSLWLLLCIQRGALVGLARSGRSACRSSRRPPGGS